MSNQDGSRGLSAHELANKIEAARLAGDRAEAQRLVDIFNDRLSGKPQPTYETAKAIEGDEIPTPTPESFDEKPGKPNHDIASLRDSVRTTKSYPAQIQPLLEKLLNEVSEELKTPRPVLEPELLREFDDLWRERQSQEPLLLRLPKHIQMRSVLLRYRNDLVNRLK